MIDKKKAGGLAGVTAGQTAIATVGKEGAGLTYRGYDIYDLAENASFEEVAYLLHRGSLPDREGLAAYVERLKRLRLPALSSSLISTTSTCGRGAPSLGTTRSGS